MRLNHPFSVRLANGSERTFATAEEMAKWIAHQRSLQMPRRTRRAAGKQSTRQTGRRTQVNRVKDRVGLPNQSPLDRFNRNSSSGSRSRLSSGSAELN